MIWMQTFCGVKFDLERPTPEMVVLDDIAHALAYTTRFGGHCGRYYSVAEHSLLVALQLGLGPFETAGRDLFRWGLMHDAAEAYVGDLLQPLRLLPELAAFRLVEARVLEAIRLRFGLPPLEEYKSDVREADLQLLALESCSVLGGQVEPWAVTQEPAEVVIEFWSPERAEQEFLNAADALGFKREG
jgi:hypothetical protein